MISRSGRVGLLVAGFMTIMPGTARAQTDVGFSPYVGAMWFDGSCVNWDDGECEGHFATAESSSGSQGFRSRIVMNASSERGLFLSRARGRRAFTGAVA